MLMTTVWRKGRSAGENCHRKDANIYLIKNPEMWKRFVLCSGPESPDSDRRSRLCAWSCTRARSGGSAPGPAGSTARRGRCLWAAAGLDAGALAADTERCSKPPSQKRCARPWRRRCCSWRRYNGPCEWCEKDKTARPKWQRKIVRSLARDVSNILNGLLYFHFIGDTLFPYRNIFPSLWQKDLWLLNPGWGLLSHLRWRASIWAVEHADTPSTDAGHARQSQAISFSYLHQRAVAISWCLRVKIIMVEDRDEPGDQRLQDPAVFLDLLHAGDQALGDGTVRHVRRCTHVGHDVFTYCLQGCKHHFVIHT